MKVKLLRIQEAEGNPTDNVFIKLEIHTGWWIFGSTEVREYKGGPNERWRDVYADIYLDYGYDARPKHKQLIEILNRVYMVHVGETARPGRVLVDENLDTTPVVF